MRVNKLHEGIIGIYGIRNLRNNKIYIGKSINIRQRIYNHIGGLNSKDPKRENQHFTNAWWKYGKESFEYFILEIFEKSENLENLLKERELYWMNFYNSTNREFGYNLRQDSSTNIIVHEETRIRLSEAQKRRYLSQEERFKTGLKSSEFWKNNPEVKEEMSKKVAEKLTKHRIYQYSKDGSELIKIWNSVSEIIKENPTYKKHNIYSVCSGAKPTIYSYKWVKIAICDIVQTELKDSE